jgi:tetratricopeptide (TPR) repeat protein
MWLELGREDPLAGLRFNLATVLGEKGDCAGAEAEVRETLRLLDRMPPEERDAGCDAFRAQALDNLVGWLHKRDADDQAVGLARQAADLIDPLVEASPERQYLRMTCGLVHLNYGIVLCGLGSAEDGIRECRRAIEILASLARDFPGIVNTSWRLAQAQVAVARELWRGPGPCGRYEAGRLEEAEHLSRDAIATLEALLARAPDVPAYVETLAEAYVGLGNVLRSAGNLDGAIAAYREAIHVKPDDAGAHGGLGSALRRRGDVAGAIRSMREVIRLEPDHAAAHADLGALLLWGEEDAEGAIAESREALRLRARMPGASLTLGYAHNGRKEHLWSAEAFRDALEEEAIRADLDQGHLYNAACSAALASAGLEGEAAGRWREQALRWLDEDLKRRRDRLAALEADPGRRAEFEQKQTRLVAHVEHGRTNDPDLASLRGSAEFERLFGAQ